MFKRAYLSITRRLSKTVVLGILMFVIANLVLATIFIKNATNESMKYAKESIGSEVYLQPDMEKLRSQNTNNNTGGQERLFRLQRPNIYIDNVKKIGSIEYVKDYSYSLNASANASGFDVIENNTNTSNSYNNNRPTTNNFGDMGNIQIEGVNAYTYISGVKNNTISLLDGTYFDESSTNKILISEELAQTNNLKVNDKIKLKNTSTNTEIELEIIGIYSSTESDDSRSFINSANRVYMNVETASKFLSTEQYNNGNYSVNNVVYYLSDPSSSDKFIKEANSLVPTLESDNLLLDINSTAYNTMVKPIESVGSFSNTVLILVVLASIVIISLLINNQIKDRKYEMGVLLSLGETKRRIVGQILVELLIVAIVAFILSGTTSLFVANKMSSNLLENQIKMNEENTNNNFGREMNIRGGGMGPFSINNNLSDIKPIDKINIVAKPLDYAYLTITGFVIIFASMIIPTINIMKYEPKTILTRRD